MQEKIDEFILNWNKSDDEQKMKMFYELGYHEDKEFVVSIYKSNKLFTNNVMRLLREKNDKQYSSVL